MSVQRPDTPTVATIEAWLRRTFPLYDHIGLTVERAGEDLESAVPLCEANANHLGGMHAAVQWACAEVLGGVVYLANPELGSCLGVVRDVTITFKKVALTGIRATARFDASQVAALVADLDATGKGEFCLDISIRDADDDVVTTAVGRYWLRRTSGRA